jgi:hypothetical protein
LALLSFRVPEEHFRDSLWLINAALGKLLRDQVSPYRFVEKPELSEDVRCDFQMPFEIVKTEFCGNFYEIPYGALSEVHDVMEILDERARLAIDTVGRCLRDCSNDAKETFIMRSLDLFRIVEQDSNMLIVIGAFCSIYEQILDKDLMGTVLPLLSKSRLYSNGDTVFNDESIDLRTNTIRHTIFQLTAQLAPELVVVSMNCFDQNPLIMTELLSRVLMNLKPFDLWALLYDHPLELIFNCALLLQKMAPYKRVFRCRSVLFTFLSELAIEHGFFRSTFFTSHFLWFMLEEKLTGFILLLLRDYLTKVKSDELLMAPANYVHEVFVGCLANSYVDLADKLLAAIVDGLRENWEYASHFSRDFTIILDIAEAGSHSNILRNSLRLLVMLSFRRPFSLSLPMTKIISGCILKVAGSDPSVTLENLLFALLASSFAHQNSMVIQIPSVIPVILCSFGHSPCLPSVLRRFSHLVKFSDHNRRMAHDGYLDLMLAKSLSSEEVQLSPDFSFRLEAPRELAEDLLLYISELKSSEAVCQILVDGIDSEAKADYLVKVLAHSRHTCSQRQFAIGQIPTQFVVGGFHSDDFNQGFSVRFTLGIDIAMASLCRDFSSVITLIDGDNAYLTVFMTGSSLTAAYQNGPRRTTVALIRTINMSAQIPYAFVFKFLENRLRIIIRQSGMSHNDSDLCYFQFEEGDIRLVVGGGDSTEGGQIVVLSDLLVFAGLPPYGVRQPAESAIFSSNWVPVSSKPGEFRIPRPFGNPAQSPAELLGATHETVRLSTNIIKAFVNSSLVNELAKKFRISGVLTIIELLFAFSDEPQINFRMVDLIQSSLLERPVSWTLYVQMYGILSAITWHDLQAEWIDKLMLNFPLWKRCPPDDFQFILRHWSAILVNSFSHIFKERQDYFTKFLARFRIYFCFERFEPPNHFVPEIPCNNGPVLGSDYTCEDILKCRYLFATFIVKLASISLSQEGLSQFVIHMRSTKSKQMVLKMLMMLRDMASFLPFLVDFAILNSLFCGDVDIDSQVVYVVHDVYETEVYGYMLGCLKNVDNIGLFETLLMAFPQFPNLLPLLCLSAIKLNALDILAMHLTSDNSSIIIRHKFWFIFPIMALFHAKDESAASDLTRFIVSVMDPLADLLSVVIFIQFLQYSMNQTDCVVLKRVLSLVFENRAFPDLANVCVNSAIFHFDPNAHHQLFDEFFGGFPDIDISKLEHTTQKSPIELVPDLETIATCDWTAFHIGFEYRLNPDRSWGDSEIAEIALGLLEPESTSRSLLLYFQDRSKLDKDKYNELAMRVDSEVSERLAAYSQATSHVLRELTYQTREWLVWLNHTCPKMDDSTKSNVDLVGEALHERPPESTRPGSEVKRDPALCISFMPMKQKWSNSNHRVKPKVATTFPFFESPAKRIKFIGEQQIHFVLMKEQSTRRHCFRNGPQNAMIR